MREALLGICAGKFNIVLTFIILFHNNDFFCFNLTGDIYTVLQPTQAVPSFLISILALLLQ